MSFKQSKMSPRDDEEDECDNSFIEGESWVSCV